MERDTSSLYNTLELNKSASPEEIKKAYRRLALRYHPDKNPNCEDQFRNVNHAYEILSDPQKKRIYDRYGTVGLNMVDTMGSAMFLDPEVEAIILAFFCLVSIIIVSLLIWLIFFCLRVDGSIKWRWAVVFIPLWAVDALVLWATIYRMTKYDPIKNEELNGQQRFDEDDDDNEQDGLLGGRRNRNTTKFQHRINQFLPFVNCILVVLFQIFIVLELDGVVDWSMIYVFLPFYAYEISNTVSNGKKGLLTQFILVLQMTLILLQLTFIKKSYSWAIVFIPAYCLGFYFAYRLWKQYRTFASYPQKQEAQQGQTIVIIASVLYGTMATLFFTVLALIIRRLDGTSHVRLSLILIPVFVILGVLLCCTGCCLPCMLITSSLPVGDMEDPEQPTQTQLIDPNRRITQNPT